jgi:hypothetical protein
MRIQGEDECEYEFCRNDNFIEVKAIPVHASTGPEGSRRLRLPYIKTIST